MNNSISLIFLRDSLCFLSAAVPQGPEAIYVGKEYQFSLKYRQGGGIILQPSRDDRFILRLFEENLKSDYVCGKVK